MGDLTDSQALRSIQAWFENRELEAFATGSRIQGTAAPDSDLDIVVIGEVNTEAIETELEALIDPEWPIDVVAYSADTLRSRLKQNDPFVVTMVQSMEPLSLSTELTESLKSAASTGDGTEYIRATESLNLERAAMALCQAVLYRVYADIVEQGHIIVPPQELPQAAKAVDTVDPDVVQRILDLKQKAEDSQTDPRSVLSELLPLLEEAGVQK